MSDEPKQEKVKWAKLLAVTDPLVKKWDSKYYAKRVPLPYSK